VEPADRFRIVVVCTGNRFRSPLAEHVLRRETEGLPVDVRSVGVLDLGGIEALPEALEAGRGLGLDLSAHRTCVLAPEPLEGADLVLGFERAHVAQAVVAGGAPLERTFTLPEVVELLPPGPPAGVEDPVGRARALVASVAGRRPDPRTSPLPELADPLGRSRSFFRQTAEQVDELSRRLVRQLFAAQPTP
jgi:low molecular weight protein-tyrosine phosphatase